MVLETLVHLAIKGSSALYLSTLEGLSPISSRPLQGYFHGLSITSLPMDHVEDTLLGIVYGMFE